MKPKKSRITKKVKDELKRLIDEKGYWSEEVREYIEQFNDYTRPRLHSKAQAYEKYGVLD